MTGCKEMLKWTFFRCGAGRTLAVCQNSHASWGTSFPSWKAVPRSSWDGSDERQKRSSCLVKELFQVPEPWGQMKSYGSMENMRWCAGHVTFHNKSCGGCLKYLYSVLTIHLQLRVRCQLMWLSWYPRGGSPEAVAWNWDTEILLILSIWRN